jgi:hypothetical protein
MMTELGLNPSAAAIGRRYGNLIDAYIVDRADAGSCAGFNRATVAVKALMENLADREALASTVLQAADRASEPVS